MTSGAVVRDREQLFTRLARSGQPVTHPRFPNLDYAPIVARDTDLSRRFVSDHGEAVEVVAFALPVGPDARHVHRLLVGGPELDDRVLRRFARLQRTALVVVSVRLREIAVETAGVLERADLLVR